MGVGPVSAGDVTGPLPEAEYRAIFQKVPRLTVEVVICSELGVLLARRIGGPCDGLWTLPGGTVRFAEPLVAAVHRVALDEINADVVIDELQGYIEYPSHIRQGIDSPVGLAFRTHLPPDETLTTVQGRLDWFRQLPDEMHDEQRAFLQAHGLAG
ncbi:MAG: NUDIX domain-containing protein [Acidimicrobiales bacterium]|jgi:ADP-ribose pyrophosphatase YjhB (NUDIX family)